MIFLKEEYTHDVDISVDPDDPPTKPYDIEADFYGLEDGVNNHEESNSAYDNISKSGTQAKKRKIHQVKGKKN